MRRLKLENLGSLKASESDVQVRFVNEHGQTEVWIVHADSATLNRLRGAVRMAGIDDQVDFRIGTQAASISRLLEHVKFHCPKFKRDLGSVFAECGFKEEED